VPPLAAILAPDFGSATFVVELFLPLLIGFGVGLLIKKFLAMGVIVAVVVALLIIAGSLSPDQVLKPLIGFLKSSSTVEAWLTRVAGYLPYSSATFIIGLIVGFLKG